MRISDYTASARFHGESAPPWEICNEASEIVQSWIGKLSSEYFIENSVAIHKAAIVEQGAILKPPCIISEGCFVAAFVYLRGGVWLDRNVILGPSTEVKSSFFCAGSKAAHFNFCGDSIIGENVNIEAGAILANYRNEWENKEIICYDGNQYIHTKRNKFGSLIGDGARIGANAVLAPGSIIAKNSIINRLSLIDQIPASKGRAAV